jgi:hypothetical protein
MSHDRGCFVCGRDQWEYRDCNEKDCVKIAFRKSPCKCGAPIGSGCPNDKTGCWLLGAQLRATDFEVVCDKAPDFTVKPLEVPMSMNDYFEVPVQAIKDEPLKALLDEAEKHLTKCEEITASTREALRHTEIAHDLACQRVIALRNEFVTRNARKERDARDRQHNVSWDDGEFTSERR